MKKVLLILFVFASMPVMAQAEATEIDWPILVAGIVLAVLEVAGRAIPDPKWNGPIGLLINLVKLVSDYLNRKK